MKGRLGEYCCLAVEDRTDVRMGNGPSSKTSMFLAAIVSRCVGCSVASWVLQSGTLVFGRPGRTTVVRDCWKEISMI